MPHFYFKGRDSAGKSVDGELQGASVDVVAAQLMSQNIIPVQIQQANKAEGWQALLAKAYQWLPQKSVSTEEMIMFCRQMYTINKAGIPIIQGLNGLSNSLTDGLLKDSLHDVIGRLEAGASLALAMQAHPKVFDNLFVNMVKVGESSGSLDKTFSQLSRYLQRDLETRRAIKSALRYPFFVMMAMVLAIAIVNTQVIPAFSEMFKKFNAELPLTTRILINISDFFVSYSELMLIVLTLIVLAVSYWAKTDNGRFRWGQWKLKIPVVGELINKASLARYTRSFSLMLQSGVPLTTSLELCSRIIDNDFLARKIADIKQGIERGDSLNRTHRRSAIFSPLVLQMIAVGEESGQVDKLLFDVAEFYENEVEYDLKNLTAKIEPILILIMSVFVMVLALGIFLPMWELYAVQK